MATEPVSVPGVWSLTGCGGFSRSHRGASSSFAFHEDLRRAAHAPRVDGAAGGREAGCVSPAAVTFRSAHVSARLTSPWLFCSGLGHAHSQ